MSFYRQGDIQPIQPTTCFDAAQVEHAFRSLQKGHHIGKLVVRIPADHSLLATAKARGSFSLRPDASYLLVGGLGGLGRSVSIWLAEHGARNLIFLSRSGDGNSRETKALVEELAAAGCSAQIVAGSVARLDDVRHVITQARLPVTGVVQMSMVLRVRAEFRITLLEAWTPCHMLTKTLCVGCRLCTDGLRRLGSGRGTEDSRDLELAHGLCRPQPRLLYPVQLDFRHSG